MLNRKDIRLAGGAAGTRRSGKEATSTKACAAGRRFVLASAKRKAARVVPTHGKTNGNGKVDSKTDPKAAGALHPTGVTINPTAAGIDLTETVKTLLHLAQENGYVTYDDINDILPDGLNPDDLDQLFTKLRGLDVEIVDQAEAERAKPAEPE
ncbi:MAG: RNA polymerase sigma factor region1.1 domain-containing protein, partial [Verrucomicrobiota bacterium]